MNPHTLSKAYDAFLRHVLNDGPMTINRATDFVRLNNMHLQDPYSQCLIWMQTALDNHDVKIYRDSEACIYYGRPKLKNPDFPKHPKPVQTSISQTPTPTIAQAAQAAGQEAAQLE